MRSYIFNTWRKISLRYGFREYDGPPLEPLELYTLKSGDEIVGQLYNFVDKGERQISLRPEMTPTLARMVAAHHGNYRKPIKWFSIPQLFRYERQQKGRLREHFQLNADIMGDDSSGADSEIIALAIDVLRAFGLTHEDFVIRLSSRSAWSDYFARRCSDQERAYEFYQIIDKLEREDPEVSRQKLSQLNLSYDEVTQFIASGEPTAELQAILDNLSARGLADFVKIDYGVIRGLAYYTGPVFEAFDRKGKFRAIAGGGRYDHLTQLISAGKVQIPSLGFGMGDVVLTELLKERGLLPEFSAPAEIYSLIEDESLRLQTLTAIQAFRDAGYSTDYALAPLKADRQFKRALELKARWTFRLEKRETPESVYLLKDLFTRKEERFGSLEQTLQFLQTQPH